jgi:methionyl-tRNA formyltransferase
MSEQKAILVCGNRIALPVLQELVFHQQLAVAVIPGKNNAFAQEVMHLLSHTGIPLLLPTAQDLVGVIQGAIQQYQPAIGFVFTCSYKIPAAVFTMLPKGFFNIHPGPLPAYRGPDPIFRQVKNKEPYAAVSIHQLDEGWDSGPVALSAKLPLAVTDTYGMLSKKLGGLAAQSVSTLMKIAAFGSAIPLRAQDAAKACFYPKQKAVDININWQVMDAVTIVALVNACNPWNKGAVTSLNQNIIRLLETSAAADNSPGDVPSGTIISIDANGMKVAALNSCLLVRMIYCDEGFLVASRLPAFGVMPGHRFDSLSV